MKLDIKDIMGKDATPLISKKLFLFDMDGTIYNENRLFDGTLDLLKYIDEIEGQYIFITNNSSKSVEEYITKLHTLGIRTDVNNFFTSTQATIQYFKHYYSDKLVYCMGTKSLVKELLCSGIKVTSNVESDAELILVGYDTELTSEKIWDVCKMLQREIPYFATNPDLACPVSFGFIPDCGSICMMLENATGRKPIFFGKPEPTMINIVRSKFGFSKEETVVIGDRLYTDIASGINAGVTSICVLTGEATITEIINSSIKPTFTFKSVREIWDVLH